MKDTVVLGGDHTITEQIDGDLNLLIGGFASSALLSILDGDIDLLQIVDGDSALDNVLDGEVGVITTIHGGAYPAYEGPTEITPSQETQVLQTEQTSVLSNIVINPIPNNYGLITWNGSALTVS